MLRFFAAALMLLFTREAKAFSLLGPYAAWMSSELGYHQPGEIGGPMGLNEEYRWNVPVLTYGFDQSFLDYFGSNGVAAVEQAIQALNALPPASTLNVEDYPFETLGRNVQAQAQGLFDLKSATLPLLLEQLGLAQPSHHIFEMRDMYYTFHFGPYETNWISWAIPQFILERNYDPETLSPSHWVNQTLYSAYVVGFGSDAVEFPVDPNAATDTAVADRSIAPGTFYTGLTRDDVGGLRYLLSATNVNFETFLPGIISSDRRKSKSGLQPGVEKLTFIRHPTNRAGKFKTLVLTIPQSTTEGRPARRGAAHRVLKQPDFLFLAADTGADNDTTPLFVRSGTSNWVNNASLNGAPDAAGPGVIRPPVTITFHKLGPLVETSDSGPAELQNQGWASFDGSGAAPLVYPRADAQTGLSVRLRGYDTSYSFGLGTNRTVVPFEVTNQLFHLDLPPGAQAALQTSTNQTDWTSVAVISNPGSVLEWHHRGHLVDFSPPTPLPQPGTWANLVFFRVIPR